MPSTSRLMIWTRFSMSSVFIAAGILFQNEK
jgi:hypothetical protein